MLILAIFSNDTAIVVTLSPIIFVNQFTITTIMSLSFDLSNGSMILMLISYYSPWSAMNMCITFSIYFESSLLTD